MVSDRRRATATKDKGSGFCLLLFLGMGSATIAGTVGALPSGEAVQIFAVAASLLAALGSFAVVVGKAAKLPDPPERAVPPKVRVFPRISVAPKGALRCPYCHVQLGNHLCAQRSCPGCQAIYHEDCLRESEGCTTLGCVHLGPRRPSLRV